MSDALEVRGAENNKACTFIRPRAPSLKESPSSSPAVFVVAQSAVGSVSALTCNGCMFLTTFQRFWLLKSCLIALSANRFKAFCHRYLQCSLVSWFVSMYSCNPQGTLFPKLFKCFQKSDEHSQSEAREKEYLKRLTQPGICFGDEPVTNADPIVLQADWQHREHHPKEAKDHHTDKEEAVCSTRRINSARQLDRLGNPHAHLFVYVARG